MNLLPKADSLAHVLHRRHLIPGAWFRWMCDRYEARLLEGS